MKIYWRSSAGIGNADIEAHIRNDIDLALKAIRTSGNNFVVNDSLWQWQNPAGKIMPCVANSAKFITKTFQSYLENYLGWKAEKSLSGQDIDAYKEFSGDFDVLSLDPARFVDLLTAYEQHYKRSAGPIASSIHMKYCTNSAPALSDELLPFIGFFQEHKKTMTLRVAVEFETGNIASSFRAANKLEFLYRESLIDLGIFITSNDKPSCAAKIWPVSNRNGSFEELERRRFAEGITVPLWQIGFAPDSFNQATGYLAEDGTLYTMQATGQTRTINGSVYEVWRDVKGQERLRLYSSI